VLTDTNILFSKLKNSSFSEYFSVNITNETFIKTFLCNCHKHVFERIYKEVVGLVINILTFYRSDSEICLTSGECFNVLLVRLQAGLRM
jgi:hypothetical protein